MSARQFEVVSNEDQPEERSRTSTVIDDAATQALMLGLKTLSKRTVAAVAELLSVGSTFVLWYLHPEPNIYQIVSLSIYAVFVLACVWLVRKH
jgi:hypothetical protein